MTSLRYTVVSTSPVHIHFRTGDIEQLIVAYIKIQNWDNELEGEKKTIASTPHGETPGKTYTGTYTGARSLIKDAYLQTQLKHSTGKENYSERQTNMSFT